MKLTMQRGCHSMQRSNWRPLIVSLISIVGLSGCGGGGGGSAAPIAQPLTVIVPSLTPQYMVTVSSDIVYGQGVINDGASITNLLLDLYLPDEFTPGKLRVRWLFSSCGVASWLSVFRSGLLGEGI